MTLPSSGSMSLSQIFGEFGGGVGSMSQLYGDGGKVPPGIGIPGSGTLHMSDFYGKSNFLQQLGMAVDQTGGTSPLIGYSGPDDLGFGSLSTTGFFAGGSITSFYWNPSFDQIVLQLDSGQGADPGQSCFGSVDINGNVYSAASATYPGFGQSGTWVWSSGNPFGGAGGSITITFR